MSQDERTLDPVDAEFVERVGRFFEGDGAARTSGRMLGLLLLATRERCRLTRSPIVSGSAGPA